VINKIETVANYIQESKYLVIFTGAGISTPSGLPDYRGSDGVWTRRDKGLKPKPLPKPWNEFEPNIAHKCIVTLQDLGYLKFLISQNVDNLHLKSGIHPDVIAELHGNSVLMKCISCDIRYSINEIKWDFSLFGRGYRTQKTHPNQPNCPNCSSRIISSIINFGDPMPEKESDKAHSNSVKSDLFIVIGSTLKVNPAASYPRIAKKNGARLVILNKGPTASDSRADINIDGDCAKILPLIIDKITKNT